MPQWYVSAQLQHFQTGLRGKHPDDVEGLRMRAMSKQMMSQAETDAVAAYVAGLPPLTNAATPGTGDPEAGKQVYPQCMACHGVDARGNEQVKAPPLAGLDDWYVRAQLKKFRTGVRGTAPGDPLGPLMRAMASNLKAANVGDIAAYVHSLPR
jgi:cytochrome c oxidase subunit 2